MNHPPVCEEGRDALLSGVLFLGMSGRQAQPHQTLGSLTVILYKEGAAMIFSVSLAKLHLPHILSVERSFQILLLLRVALDY